MSTVRIIHPETGAIAEVPESSLYQHYQSGWTLLAEEPPAPPPPQPPAPMTAAQASNAKPRATASEEK